MMKRITFTTFVLVLTAIEPARGGSFVPSAMLESRGIDIINRSVARKTVDRDLFGSPHASVVVGQIDVYDRFPYVEARTFLVVSDPEWNRLLFGEADKGFTAYDGKGSPFGRLRNPRGMAADAGGRIYVADTDNRRIAVLQARNEYDRLELVPLFVIGGLGRPYDVAHSDAGTPFDASDDLLYVADTGKNRVLRYELTRSGAVLAGAVGALGSGKGRFAGPMAIAVGRHSGTNTADLFVSDAHNRRIVHLRDTGEGLAWRSSAKIDAALVTSLDTDHWGNLYAAAPDRGQVTKYTPSLLKLAEWKDEIVRPRSFHIPFLNVNDHRSGTTVRAGQGSGVLVEEWTAETGIRLARFGVEIKDLTVRSGEEVSAEYTLTDRAHVKAEIIDAASQTTIAAYDLGAQNSGAHVMSISSSDLFDKPSFGAMTIRISAQSSYDKGEGDRVEAGFFLVTSDNRTPARAALLGNQPNPFNPTTTIRFALPSGGPHRCSLRIFDALGRLIRTLRDGSLESGFHSVVWDGRNDEGIGVPSGVYLSRLDINGREQTAKMVLLR